MSVGPSYAQSMCDPNFWKFVQPKDIEQIKEPGHICKNQDYEETVDIPVFHVATLYASPEVLLEFLNKNYSLNINLHSYHIGATALHWAAVRGRSEIIQILVDAGANPDIKNNYGSTALHWGSSKWTLRRSTSPCGCWGQP